jgi:polar amino acid transport system substrate-binding protein
MLAACGSAQGSTDTGSSGSAETADASSDVEAIKAKGKLLIGITDFAPMDYKDDNGEWIGFDADMAKEIAKSLGVEAEFVEIDWDNKILELENGSIDVVWNGMTLTPEVTESMECTKAYCNNAQVVVVKSDVADKYSSKDSLSELTFAVESGSAGEAAASENGLEYLAVKSQADAVMEVEAGTSDGCIIDLLMAGAMIGEGTGYEDLAHTVELTSEEYGIGCRKGSDLAAYINDQMKTLYDNKTMTEIATKYGVQEAVVAQ